MGVFGCCVLGHDAHRTTAEPRQPLVFFFSFGRLRVSPMRLRYTIFGTGRGLGPMDSEAALGADGLRAALEAFFSRFFSVGEGCT